jgi:hypothetical protein
LAEHCSGLSRRFDVMQIPMNRLRRIKEPLGVDQRRHPDRAGRHTRRLPPPAARAGRHAQLHGAKNSRGEHERDALGYASDVPGAAAARRAECGATVGLVTAQTRAANVTAGAAPLVLFQAIGVLPNSPCAGSPEAWAK